MCVCACVCVCVCVRVCTRVWSDTYQSTTQIIYNNRLTCSYIDGFVGGTTVHHLMAL